jgi:Resolvase, N terminal domain
MFAPLQPAEMPREHARRQWWMRLHNVSPLQAKCSSATGYTRHNETRWATSSIDRQSRTGSLYSKRSIAVHYGMAAPRRIAHSAPQGTVVAYLRVSTDEQATSGAGLDAQRAAIAAEVERRGWQIVAWHADEGISGGKGVEYRPGLAAAIKSGSAASPRACTPRARWARRC